MYGTIALVVIQMLIKVLLRKNIITLADAGDVYVKSIAMLADNRGTAGPEEQKEIDKAIDLFQSFVDEAQKPAEH